MPTCSCKLQTNSKRFEWNVSYALDLYAILLYNRAISMYSLANAAYPCAICWTARKTNWTQSKWYVLWSKFNVCVLESTSLFIDWYWISTMLNNIQAICKWGVRCAVCEWEETWIDKWRFLRTWKVIDKLRLRLLLLLLLSPLLLLSRIHNTTHFLHYFWCFRFACLQIVYFLPVIALERQLQSFILKSKT